MTLGAVEANIEAPFQATVRVTLWCLVVAQPLLYLLSRRLPSVAYLVHTTLNAATIYLVILTASIPLAEVMPTAMVYQAVSLFVALLLLRPGVYVAVSLVVTAVNIGLALLALQGAHSAYHADTMVGMILVTILFWLLTVATSMLIAHHINELGRAKESLQRTNVALEGEVQRRARIIEQQQRQLFAASKMESLGTLAGGIAHDFNNLLTGIRGNAELLGVNLDVSHLDRPHLDAIIRCADSGAGLTRQLLGFARRGQVEIVPTDANELVERCVAVLRRTRKDVTFESEYAGELPAIEVDRDQMEQVLLNLLTNATQAVQVGGHITVRTSATAVASDEATRRELEPGRYIEIAVVDDGVGMDEPTRQRVFEPFFTTKPMGRGTGLGLASAFGIVRLHGGTIEVSSTPDVGSTFTVLLRASDATIRPRVTQAEEEPSTGVETILVVDDEDDVRLVASRMLARLGYHVIEVSDGPSALQHLGNGEAIDLVLLDLVMPGMGGETVFEQLRQHHPELPVLLVSGYSADDMAAELMDRPLVGFVQKPFRLAALGDQVRVLLDSR
jgi:signal transduction histidine kinase